MKHANLLLQEAKRREGEQQLKAAPAPNLLAPVVYLAACAFALAVAVSSALVIS